MPVPPLPRPETNIHNEVVGTFLCWCGEGKTDIEITEGLRDRSEMLDLVLEEEYRVDGSVEQ